MLGHLKTKDYFRFLSPAVEICNVFIQIQIRKPHHDSSLFPATQIYMSWFFRGTENKSYNVQNLQDGGGRVLDSIEMLSLN